MTAQLLAQAAYAGRAAPTRTERSIEYDAFARVTRLLINALLPDTPFGTLAQALHDNRALWIALASDVADPANPLPPTLRARIFYLAEFTLAQSSKVLSGEEGVQALVDVNMAVMRGLRPEEDRT